MESRYHRSPFVLDCQPFKPRNYTTLEYTLPRTLQEWGFCPALHNTKAIDPSSYLSTTFPPNTYVVLQTHHAQVFPSLVDDSAAHALVPCLAVLCLMPISISFDHALISLDCQFQLFSAVEDLFLLHTVDVCVHLGFLLGGELFYNNPNVETCAVVVPASHLLVAALRNRLAIASCVDPPSSLSLSISA